MTIQQSEDDRIAESVATHGWHAIAVEGTEDEPPFLYTIGLGHTLAHPELVILGLEAGSAHSILRDMVRDIRAGRRYEASERYPGVLEGFDILIRPVHPTHHLMLFGYTAAFYRRLARPKLFRVCQVFWPDKAGLFPTDLKCDPRVAQKQPRLGLAVPPSELKAFRERYGTR